VATRRASFAPVGQEPARVSACVQLGCGKFDLGLSRPNGSPPGERDRFCPRSVLNRSRRSLRPSPSSPESPILSRTMRALRNYTFYWHTKT
jgi:hypothetical protein